METKINFSEVPYHYPLCLKRECPVGGTCLRQLAEQCVPDTVETWHVISPRYLALVKGDCPYYRSSNKVRFARGFIGMLENMPGKQMKLVISTLIDTFSRRTYFRIRKGERPLSPSEQQAIVDILKRHNVAGPYVFDAYFDGYEW